MRDKSYHLKENLTNLETYITMVKSNIETLNQHVKVNLKGLKERGKRTYDLMTKLFKAYYVVSDTDFILYISTKKYHLWKWIINHPRESYDCGAQQIRGSTHLSKTGRFVSRTIIYRCPHHSGVEAQGWQHQAVQVRKNILRIKKVKSISFIQATNISKEIPRDTMTGKCAPRTSGKLKIHKMDTHRPKPWTKRLTIGAPTMPCGNSANLTTVKW